jgi:hypothetical protein
MKLRGYKHQGVGVSSITGSVARVECMEFSGGCGGCFIDIFIGGGGKCRYIMNSRDYNSFHVGYGSMKEW